MRAKSNVAKPNVTFQTLKILADTLEVRFVGLLKDL
jgi:hypothetical protein